MGKPGRHILVIIATALLVAALAGLPACGKAKLASTTTTVNSSNQITVNIAITGAATPGSRDVSLTTPGGTGTKTGGFTVNQAPPNQPLNTPSDTSLANGATGLSLTPTLQSSAFSDPDAGDTHAASQWQIRTSSGSYSSPTLDSGTDVSHLTSIIVPSGILNGSTTYYWHVRHQDNQGAWSAWSAETSFTTETTDHWAIIVGVSTYQYQADAEYADNDALSLYDTLKPIWGEDHLKLLVNAQATKSNIYDAISGWLDPLEDADDVVLFFFSGHGEQNGSSETICPYDTLTDSWTNDIYDYELNTWLGNLQSGKQVVILDCCYAGGFINRGRGVKFDSSATGVPSDFVKQLSNSGRVVLTSSTGTESSWASEELGHGVFTYHLLKAFSWLEVVDSNGDGRISAEELFEYAEPRTVAYTTAFESTTQHPQMSDGYAGELTLFTAVNTTFGTSPAIASLTIDGLAYSLSELPVSKEFISGTPHTLDVSSTSGVQEAIDTESPHPYPNDYDNTWVVMRQDATRIRVHFNYISTEHNYDYVYIKDNGGSVSATYSGIYDHMWSAWVSGDTLKIQLDSDWSGAGNGFAIDGVEWESTGTRYEFTSWGDGATSTSRTMTADAGGPATYTANYATQCYLTVQSEQGDPQGGGWYDKGVTAPFSVTSFVDQGNGTGYAFTCWSGDSNGTSSISSVVMGSPKTVTANWNVQYRLTVNSQWGAPQGAGWYDSGATAAFSVSPLIDQGSATRYAFTNWSGDSTETSNSSSIVMDSPKVVTANWKLQYYLTVQPDRGNPQGSEWYDAGTEATISVRSPIGTIIRRVFSGWSGDSTVSTKTATIVMDSPKSVIADWRTDYTRLYILIIGILLAFGLAGAVMVLVRRRQVYAPVPVKEAEATTAIERAPEQQTVQNTTNEKPQQEAEQVGCPLCGSTDVFEEAGIRRCGGCCIILPR